MNPTTLIQSAQAGDLNAFNEIVLQYQERLFNIAARMLENPASAEDAVQNAFILAYRSLSNFRGGSFDFWLLRILKNVCYDELRRRKRHLTCPLEPLIDEDEEFETPLWLTDHAQNPARQAEAAELSQAISTGLQRLSPGHRLVLILIDIDGCDYCEAADIAGVPVGTIKSRLARARLKLRQELLRSSDLLPGVYANRKNGLTAPALLCG